jgi:hypothetical protein
MEYMSQIPFSPICDCCGLPIRPDFGEDCPRCHYPLSLVKEELFLEASLRDLQRVANHGGANLTISGLIGRYRIRQDYLRRLKASVVSTYPILIQSARPLEQSPTNIASPQPVIPQEVVPLVPTFSPLESAHVAVPPEPSFPAIPPLAVAHNQSAQTPAPIHKDIGQGDHIPYMEKQNGEVLAPKPPPLPVVSAIVVPSGQEPQSPPRRGFSFSWRSFVVDQAITIIGLLGAFLILMGALSSVVTTGANPLLSFLIVFGVHAFFGIAGVISFRFANFKLIARIYSGIYVLLVPLVGYTGYNLMLGTQIQLSVPTLIAIAAVYAAIVYTLLAIYERFPIYGYLGAMAVIVADLAAAASLHLNYWWWPSMLMLLALPALASIVRDPTMRRERYFTDFLLVLRQPVRAFMYTIVGICLLSAVVITAASLVLGSISTYFFASMGEIHFSILSMTALLLIWTSAWFWLTKCTRGLTVLALLFLTCALAFCYALNFSQSGYALALVSVALLYHGLNRFAAPLLQPFRKLGLYLDLIALALVCLAPFISSYLSPQQLFSAAYQLPLDNNPNLYVHANWAAVAELIAVGVGCIITVSMSLLRADHQEPAEVRRNNWSWLLLLSGLLLNWAFSTLVLALNLVPIWCFVGLTLALVVIAVLVRERFRAYWANPIDVLVLGEVLVTLSLSLNLGADHISTLLLGFAALFYTVVLYQRRQRWLFLPLVFAVLALPILLLSRPYVALLIGALLPFAAVAIRHMMAYRTQVVSENITIKPGLTTIWEWPLLAVGLFYGVISVLFDIFVLQNSLFPHSIVEDWLGVTFPVTLELVSLSLVWYTSAALTRSKWWLIPVIGFAVAAVLYPGNPFWVLVAVTPIAAVLGFAVSRRFDRTWASPLYIVALLSAVMTGIAVYQHQGQLFASSWILLGFGLLFYVIGLLEDLEPCLWLLPAFTTWSLIYAAQLGDLYRPPTIALLYAGVGVAIGLLNLVTLPFRTATKNNFLKFALSFYASAFVAAVLTGVYGTLPGAQPPFYGAIPDALLIYALAAFGVVLFERQPRWLWLVAGFAAWATLLAAQLPIFSIFYVTGIGLGAAIVGLLLGRIIKQRAVNSILSPSFPITVRLSWGWPWYLVSLFAAIVVGCWPIYNTNLSGFAEYTLLAFAVLAYIVGIGEDFVPLLWIAPLLAIWSLIDSAISLDAPRLLTTAIVCTALGVATSSLKFIPRFAETNRKFFNYALPFYATAFAAALLTGMLGTIANENPLFYLVVLMLYALIAYALAFFERQPYWHFIAAGFAVWATLLAIDTSTYYVVGIAIAAGIAGMLTGWLIKRPAVDNAAPMLVQWQQQFIWSWPWYITALVAAVVTGLWPYLPVVTSQPVGGFIEYALLAFAVLFYIVGVVEDRIEVLWIGSLFATWSLVISARGNDFPRLLIVTFVYTILGVVSSSLKFVPAISDANRSNKLSRYAFPFYATALIAAILGNCDITLYTLYEFFNGSIPDALPLLLYAAIAFGVLFLERQPRWLALVAGFGIWGTLLAPRASIEWVIGIAIVTALIGLLFGRIIKQPTQHSGGLLSRYNLSTFAWSWPWYLTSLVAMFWIIAWQMVYGAGSQSGLLAYSLLVFTVLTVFIMLIERVPEMLILPVLFSALTILLWQPLLDITTAMIAYTLICVLVFASQFVWKVITPLTRTITPSILHNVTSIGGQLLIVLIIIGDGGLFASSGTLTFVGAGSLFVLAVMLFCYGYIQKNSHVRRCCSYTAGLLVSLVVSWTLAAFGQINLNLLTLAPATYLTVIAPVLLRDEAMPQHRRIGEIIAVLGAALLLLPTLWLSFTYSEGNLLYTLVLIGEALLLLLLGIGVGVRVFVLTGAGLIVVAALHALFLPTLGIPTPLALTILGVTLLAIATALSLVRRRLRSAWSQWD